MIVECKTTRQRDKGLKLQLLVGQMWCVSQ